MKTRENKAMRFASVLLVLTLLATSLTAGTFAKYVTSANGSAEARVAKFGVDVSVDAANVFGEKYDSTGVVTSTDSNITVDADTEGQNVVAPGTKGEMTFSITGTPETSVNLKIEMTDIEEVMLAGGSYANKDEDVTLNSVYNPVKWTLKKGEQIESNLQNTTLAKINEYFTTLSKNAYAPGELSSVAGNYKLSWEWAIQTADVADVDVADTILGDLAAVDGDVDGIGIKKDSQDITTDDFKLNEKFTLTISVEQAD